MPHRKCFKCSRSLPGEEAEPHSLCRSCRPAACSAESRCNECSHLSARQFQAYVALRERSDSSAKKRSKSSGGSSDKKRQEDSPSSDPSWARRFEAFESDMVAVKATLAQLSAALLSPTSGSPFSGFQRPVFPGTSAGQVSADPGFSAEVGGLGGAGLCTASLPEFTVAASSPVVTQAPGIGSVETPSVLGSSSEFAGAEEVSRHTTIFPGVRATGGMCSQVTPQPEAVGVSPGAAVESQAVGTNHPSFLEVDDGLCGEGHFREDSNPNGEDSAPFRDLREDSIPPGEDFAPF